VSSNNNLYGAYPTNNLLLYTVTFTQPGIYLIIANAAAADPSTETYGSIRYTGLSISDNDTYIQFPYSVISNTPIKPSISISRIVNIGSTAINYYVIYATNLYAKTVTESQIKTYGYQVVRLA
jgi:hypothetical protein